MEKKFILVNRANDSDTVACFERNFIIEESFRLGDWEFKTTSKFNEQTFIKLETLSGHFYFSCGSLLYKGRSGKAALKRITDDFNNNKLDIDSLKGNFVILIWNGTTITFIKDRLGVQHLFQRSDGTCFSNSFLALLTSSGKKFTLDRCAVNEKVTTGFLTGEETLVEEIKKIDNDFPYVVDEKQVSLFKFPTPNYNVEFHRYGKEKSIKKNIEVLEEYFKELNVAKPNSIGDIGLSSGFDCRLILATANKNLDRPLHIHSHNTQGVHDNEIKYALQIAKIYGTKVQLIPTTRLEESEEDVIKKTLQENLRFFDGRSARHLGSFSETYTSWYKKSSMGDADYSVNGLGGEIYRDSYFMGSRNLVWEDWAKRFLFFPLSMFAVGGNQKLLEISYGIKSKIEKKLDSSFDKVDLLRTHSHYGFIKMPECNGSLAQAYGNVSEFYFPFIDYPQVLEALKAVPYLGIGGSYQAKMITKISPEIASIRSHYGFPFDKLSLKYLIWSYIKTKGPISTREKLIQSNILNSLNSSELTTFLALVSKSPYLSKIKLILKKYCPEIDFDIMVSHTTTRRIILFIGAFLVEYQEYFE